MKLVTGTVVDSEQKPLYQVRVTLQASSGDEWIDNQDPKRTRSDGTFEFKFVRKLSRAYRVHLRKKDYVACPSATIGDSDWEENHHDFSLLALQQAQE